MASVNWKSRSEPYALGYLGPVLIRQGKVHHWYTQLACYDILDAHTLAHTLCTVKLQSTATLSYEPVLWGGDLSLIRFLVHICVDGETYTVSRTFRRASEQEGQTPTKGASG